MKLIVRQQKKLTGGASAVKLTKMSLPSTTNVSSLRRTPEQTTERLTGTTTQSPTPPVGMIMYVPG